MICNEAIYHVLHGTVFFILWKSTRLPYRDRFVLKKVLMGKSSHYETNVRVWDFRFQALFLCQN